MTKDEEKQLHEHIETLIDRYGMEHFLSMSGFVAGEKAEHIAHCWQDASKAKLWMKISVGLDILTHKAEEWKL